MIVVINKKDFKNNLKSLTKSGKYAILNATDDDKISRLGTVDAGDEFHELEPPDILCEKNIASHVYDKKLNAWLKTPALKRAFAVAAAMQLSDRGQIMPDEKINKNVFIVMEKKAYKCVTKPLIQYVRDIMYKLEKDDGPVIIDFRKAYKYADTDIHEALRAELKKLDKKIDKMTEDMKYISSSMFEFDDDDIKSKTKKINKLRKKRKELVSQLESSSNINKDTISSDTLVSSIKHGAISKSARKKLMRFIKKYYDHDAVADFHSTRY